MIGNPTIGTLAHAQISGVAHQGLTVTTADGRPARLAIIDEAGNVLEAGPEVATEAWSVTLATYRNFLIGQGHLVVKTGIEDVDTRAMGIAA